MEQFLYHLDELLIHLYDIKDINKDELKALIDERLTLRSDITKNDYDYIQQLRNSLNNLISTIDTTLKQKQLQLKQGTHNQPEPTEKYITGANLSTILNITKANITNLRRQNKFFTNTIQGGKGNKLNIPYSDIDEYIKDKPKYKEKWEQYKLK